MQRHKWSDARLQMRPLVARVSVINVGSHVVAIAVIANAFLLVLPSVAYAHGEALYSAAWTLIGIYQLVCIVWMISWKGLQGRRYVACLVYAIILGLLWWAVLYGFQAEPKFHPALESEMRKMGLGDGIAERLERNYRYFEDTFGRNYAAGLHIMFIFGLPILLPPILAWGLYRFLKRDTSSPKG